MKGIETGKDKVKKICDVLRRETLEPAKNEAEEIIQEARRQADDLIVQAKKEIENLQRDSQMEIERQKNIFQSSLSQACKQALESLKQTVEEKLLNPALAKIVMDQTQKPEVIAQLIQAVVKAIQEEGIDANLSVYVPAAVPARTVNEMLGKEIVQRLKEKSVLLGTQAGGVEVKLHDKNITIDISDVALKELIGRYIRKDFRDMFFGG